MHGSPTWSGILGTQAWSKSHQAFYDRAFEGVCLLKKEEQVLLRSTKHPWFLQHLVKKFFTTYFIKSVKGHVFSMKYLQESPSCGSLSTCLGAAPPFC